MIKVNTIEQFKIMEYLNTKLELNRMEINLIDRNTVRVTDSVGEMLTFKYENGSITWY